MTKPEPKEYTRTDLGFAGCGWLFDAEGCISMSRTKEPGRYILTLRTTMVGRAKLEQMNSLLGAGTLRMYGPRPGRKPYWTWFCGKKEEVIRILQQLQPHLDLKALEAKLALDYLLGDNLTTARRVRIYEAMRRAKTRPNQHTTPPRSRPARPRPPAPPRRIAPWK